MMRIILVLVMVLAVTACTPEGPPPKPLVTGVYQDLQGRTVDLVALRGKWVVINYWASWCKPCFTEIPELNKFYKNARHCERSNLSPHPVLPPHGGKERPRNFCTRGEVVMLGVSFDRFDSPKALEGIVKKMDIQFPVLTTDPAAALGIKMPPALPATYIINPKGEVQAELLGLQTEESLEAAIKEQGEW
ncbi:MAG: TlpA family protein disulfide reductase [Gammaproteobacteria bacterium]